MKQTTADLRTLYVKRKKKKQKVSQKNLQLLKHKSKTSIRDQKKKIATDPKIKYKIKLIKSKKRNGCTKNREKS